MCNSPIYLPEVHSYEPCWECSGCLIQLEREAVAIDHALTDNATNEQPNDINDDDLPF